MPRRKLTEPEYNAVVERAVRTAPEGLDEEQFNAFLEHAISNEEAAAAGSDVPANASVHGGVGDVASGFFSSLLGAGKGLVDLVTTDPRTTIRNFIDSQVGQGKKAIEDFGQGRYSEAAGHGLASVLPFVGPAAANIGDKLAATGNLGEAAGEAGGLALTSSPSMLGSSIKGTGSAIRGVAEAVGSKGRLAGPALLLHGNIPAGLAMMTVPPIAAKLGGALEATGSAIKGAPGRAATSIESLLDAAPEVRDAVTQAATDTSTWAADKARRGASAVSNAVDAAVDWATPKRIKQARAAEATERAAADAQSAATREAIDKARGFRDAGMSHAEASEAAGIPSRGSSATTISHYGELPDLDFGVRGDRPSRFAPIEQPEGGWPARRPGRRQTRLDPMGPDFGARPNSAIRPPEGGWPDVEPRPFRQGDAIPEFDTTPGGRPHADDLVEPGSLQDEPPPLEDRGGPASLRALLADESPRGGDLPADLQAELERFMNGGSGDPIADIGRSARFSAGRTPTLREALIGTRRR